MTNVNDSTPVEIPSDLRALRLPELQRIASSLGITGLSKLRKGDLIASIEDKRPAAEAPAAEAQKGPELDTGGEADMDVEEDMHSATALLEWVGEAVGKAVWRGRPGICWLFRS